MAIKTQGTQLYFVHPATQDIINVGCITSIENVGAPIQARDVTPVESEQDVSEPGMFSPGQIDMTVLFDPSAPSHIDVYKLYKSRAIINFAIGLGDGVDDPVIDSGGEFVGVFGRSFLTFRGWIMDVPFSFPVNENLPATISIVQVPSLIDGVYGVGLFPKGGGGDGFLTSNLYPVLAFDGASARAGFVGGALDDIVVNASAEMESLSASAGFLFGSCDVPVVYYDAGVESVSASAGFVFGSIEAPVVYYDAGIESLTASAGFVSGSLVDVVINYTAESESVSASAGFIGGSLEVP